MNDREFPRWAAALIRRLSAGRQVCAGHATVRNGQTRVQADLLYNHFSGCFYPCLIYPANKINIAWQAVNIKLCGVCCNRYGAYLMSCYAGE